MSGTAVIAAALILIMVALLGIAVRKRRWLAGRLKAIDVISPITIVMIAVAVVGAILILGLRGAVNERDVDVIVLSRDVASGEILTVDHLKKEPVDRADAVGTFRHAAGVEGKVALSGFKEGHRLKVDDLGDSPVAVDVGLRAFAIPVTDGVVLSEDFRTGDKVDLLFAGPNPHIVESVRVAQLTADPLILVVALNEDETRRVLIRLGRARLVVTRAS